MEKLKKKFVLEVELSINPDCTMGELKQFCDNVELNAKFPNETKGWIEVVSYKQVKA